MDQCYWHSCATEVRRPLSTGSFVVAWEPGAHASGYTLSSRPATILCHFNSDARLSVILLHRFEDVVTPRYYAGTQSNEAVTSLPALQT
jgi:hypothetical protein